MNLFLVPSLWNSKSCQDAAFFQLHCLLPTNAGSLWHAASFREMFWKKMCTVLVLYYYCVLLFELLRCKDKQLADMTRSWNWTFWDAKPGEYVELGENDNCRKVLEAPNLPSLQACRHAQEQLTRILNTDRTNLFVDGCFGCFFGLGNTWDILGLFWSGRASCQTLPLTSAECWGKTGPYGIMTLELAGSLERDTRTLVAEEPPHNIGTKHD